jgi:hypothetical protein
MATSATVTLPSKTAKVRHLMDRQGAIWTAMGMKVRPVEDQTDWMSMPLGLPGSALGATLINRTSGL